MAIISLIYQLNAYYIIEDIFFYQLSPTCFGAYCTILRENFVSLAQNYSTSHSLSKPALDILQRNFKRSTFVVWEMKRNVSVVCVCSAPNC